MTALRIVVTILIFQVKNLSFERIVSVAAHGTEKEAERLCYDILCDNVADMIRTPPFDITAIIKLEDERFAKHLGITNDELQELRKKLYEQQG